MSKTNNKFPRGSLWRKWDLHIHSECGSPKDIVNKIIEKGISVFSITDHTNVDKIDEYIAIVEAKQNVSIEIYFLPGIELRTDKGGKSVHLIGIFPLLDKDGNKINAEYLRQNLLSKIDCSTTDIINAGKSVLSANLKNDKYYKRGLVEKVVSFEDTSEKIRNLGGIVIVHGGTKSSGIEQEMSHAKNNSNQALLNSLGHTKRNLMNNYIDICELPNWNKANLIEREFYYKEFYKPSIVCSDSHELSNIGQKFTWIKADPTFDGLKQILYEPIDRVHHGNDLPKLKNDANIIDKILIENSNNWFGSEPIYFNENLVAIIGEKGAGKTALADLIAYACGDFYSDESDMTSFIYKALKSTKQIEETIDNCKVTIYWCNSENRVVNIHSDKSLYEKSNKIKYLSQSFIERKCHPENAEEFQYEIENIIFQHIPVQERMEQTTFSDLKKFKTQAIENKKNRCKELIEKLNIDIFNLENEINSLEEKQEEEKKLLKEIKQLKSQKPKPSSKEEEEIEEKLILLSKQKEIVINDISFFSAQQQKISSIKTKVDLFKDKFEQELGSIKDDLKEIDLEFLINEIKISISQKFYEMLSKKEKGINSKINKITGKKEDISDFKKNKENLKYLTEKYINKLSLVNLDAIIKIIESKSSIEEIKRNLIKEIDQKIEKKEKRIKSLKKHIQDIINIKKPLLPIKVEERRKKYNEYINLLIDEKDILNKMYSPLSKKLNIEENNNKSKLEFFARIEFDVDNFYEKAQNIIDFSRKSKYYQNAPLLYKNIKNIAEIIELSEKQNIFELISSLFESFFEDGFKNSELPIKKSKERIDFYNWIFNVSDFQVYYSIKYEGTNIELLSPGKKGIILLLIYLSLDTENAIPLIIDQPEENLDNKSVYADLINFFREAKKRRQIFIVTHNPNLVLNTDAEQIIIANFNANPPTNEYRIKWITGAIENSYIDKEIPILRKTIKEQGSEILEGGRIAFTKRRDKWEFIT